MSSNLHHLHYVIQKSSNFSMYNKYRQAPEAWLTIWKEQVC